MTAIPAPLRTTNAFDIAEPLTDSLTAYSLSVNYRFATFDLTSSTARWTRNSSQVEEASEAFNNPLEGITYSANYGLPNPGYYGPTGSGPEYPVSKMIPPISSARSCGWRRRGPQSELGCRALLQRFLFFVGLQWHHAQLLRIYGSWNTRAGNHTPLVRRLLAHHALAICGLRRRDLCPDRCAQGRRRCPRESLRLPILFLPQRLGISPRIRRALVLRSCRAVIDSFNPKFNLAYTLSPDLMAYATVSTGFRPGGGNAAYPTSGSAWGGAFQQQGYTSGKWPSTYEPDRVLSYELGEKARMFDHRLTVNASIYYEDWRHVQLEAVSQRLGPEHQRQLGLHLWSRYRRARGPRGGISARSRGRLPVRVAGRGAALGDRPGPQDAGRGSGESGTVALSYFKPLGDSYTFTARLENAYTGPRYSIFFSNPYEFTGTYRQLPGYDLINVRAGVRFHDKCSASVFINNLTNKRVQLESMFTENEPQPSFTRIETNQPLTGGIDLTYRF